MLMFEVPLEKMTFQEDPKKKLYRLRFSLLALVRDPEGRIVERFSDDYPFEGPLDKLAGVKRGNLIFKRPFTLTPGEYTVDYVAQDRDSGRTSVQKASLLRPPPRASRSAASTSSAASRRRGRRCRSTTRSGSIACAWSRTWTCRSQEPEPESVRVLRRLREAGDDAEDARSSSCKATRWSRARARNCRRADKEGRIPYVGTFPIAGFGPAGTASRPGHGRRQGRRVGNALDHRSLMTYGQPQRHGDTGTHGGPSWNEDVVPFVGSVRSPCFCASVVARRRALTQSAAGARASAPASIWSPSTSSCSTARASRCRA